MSERRIKLKPKAQENLMNVAYETIKQNICDNTIEEGSLLSESTIADKLGMSRTPVREALKVLTIEGLVETRVGVGAYVRPITYKEFVDIYEVRKALEVVAAKTAIKNISKQELDQVEEKLNGLLDRYHNEEEIHVDDFTNLDLAVHDLLIKRCDNDTLKSVMGNLMSNVRRVQSMSYKALNDIEESTAQHLNLIAIIRKRDYAELAQAIEAHIQWSIDCMKLF